MLECRGCDGRWGCERGGGRESRGAEAARRRLRAAPGQSSGGRELRAANMFQCIVQPRHDCDFAHAFPGTGYTTTAPTAFLTSHRHRSAHAARSPLYTITNYNRSLTNTARFFVMCTRGAVRWIRQKRVSKHLLQYVHRYLQGTTSDRAALLAGTRTGTRCRRFYSQFFLNEIPTACSNWNHTCRMQPHKRACAMGMLAKAKITYPKPAFSCVICVLQS